MYKFLLNISFLLITFIVYADEVKIEELTIPNFNLPQVQDVEKSLNNQDLLGKVIVLNVWESSCRPCIEEHPFLLQLAQQNIPIYGINMQDNLANANLFLVKRGNPYLGTAFDSDGFLSKQLGVIGTPTTLIADQYSRIQYKKEGPLGEQDIQEILLLIRELKQK